MTRSTCTAPTPTAPTPTTTACADGVEIANGDDPNDPDDHTDADHDGVTANLDCDDGDPDNFPGNTEVCDGGDNDCDGVADQVATLLEDMENGATSRWQLGIGTAPSITTVTSVFDGSTALRFGPSAGNDCQPCDVRQSFRLGSVDVDAAALELSFRCNVGAGPSGDASLEVGFEAFTPGGTRLTSTMPLTSASLSGCRFGSFPAPQNLFTTGVFVTQRVELATLTGTGQLVDRFDVVPVVSTSGRPNAWLEIDQIMLVEDLCGTP
ncbi:MAG: putative metal-binding motif-containing protein [Alphaproteobacteria bacterium]|nr:putative metal-binding motif-containing protein [Alphaproteobacteria bacterium]